MAPRSASKAKIAGQLRELEEGISGLGGNSPTYLTEIRGRSTLVEPSDTESSLPFRGTRLIESPSGVYDERLDSSS